MTQARMIDVAERADVSVTTVSNVVNNPASVAAGTRRRVEQVMADLGYVPNEHARALRRTSSRIQAAAAREEPRDTPSSTGITRGRQPGRPPGPPFGAGDRIQFRSADSTLTGVVDEATPDGSIVWIWEDGGLGRKLLSTDEGVIEPNVF